MKLEIMPLPADKMKAKFQDQSKLGFGKHFADRMLLAEWHAGKGWCDARIKPYEPFVLDPSCIGNGGFWQRYRCRHHPGGTAKLQG